MDEPTLQVESDLLGPLDGEHEVIHDHQEPDDTWSPLTAVRRP